MQCLVLAFFAVLYLLYSIMSFIHFLCFICHVSPEVVLQRSLSCKDPEKHGATFCCSALDELFCSLKHNDIGSTTLFEACSNTLLLPLLVFLISWILGIINLQIVLNFTVACCWGWHVCGGI